MSRCLCCGKEIGPQASWQEQKSQWHKRCVKKFFSTNVLPDIDLSEEVLQMIAIESTTQGFTVPGVQKKLSLHLTDNGKAEIPRLTLVNYPTGYILKPQTAEYACLPEAEYLVMSMADAVGIKTVPHALICHGSQLAYITKRIDREISKKNIKMYAMEDFCQLDGRLTQDKYRGSYERCGKIITGYSSRPGLDMTELFLRVVFSFLVGNSDMHLKNFSLIETDVNSQTYVLSAAYDMLPVNMILPEDQEQFALTLNGKKRNITRNDFLKFADNCQIDQKIALRLIDQILKKEEILIRLCEESYMPADMREQLEELMRQRASVLRQTPCS